MPCHSQRIVCSSRTGLIGGNHPASVSHFAAENKSAAATTNAVAAKLRLLLGQFCEQGRVNSDERQGQGAWILLRQSVVDTEGFDGWDRVLFHIDEAMSWETVRDLARMSPLLLTIRNLCSQGEAPQEVMANIDDVNDILREVLQEYHK